MRSVEKTPFELWKPDLSGPKVFGCDACVYVPEVKHKKMERCAEKLTFVGYECRSKSYRFRIKQTGKIIVSQNAKFLELGAKVKEELEPVVRLIPSQ